MATWSTVNASPHNLIKGPSLSSVKKKKKSKQNNKPNIIGKEKKEEKEKRKTEMVSPLSLCSFVHEW